MAQPQPSGARGALGVEDHGVRQSRGQQAPQEGQGQAGQASPGSSMQISQETSHTGQHAGSRGGAAPPVAGGGRAAVLAGQPSSSTGPPPLPPPLPAQSPASSSAPRLPPLPDSAAPLPPGEPGFGTAYSHPQPLPLSPRSQSRPGSPVPPPPPPPQHDAAGSPSLPPGFGSPAFVAAAANGADLGSAGQLQPQGEPWSRPPPDAARRAAWLLPGSADLPPWLPRLFMDACHRLARERGLPLADAWVLDAMAQLTG